jgi:hypothetical protein
LSSPPVGWSGPKTSNIEAGGIRDLGNGVVLPTSCQGVRPLAGSGSLVGTGARVIEGVERPTVRVTVYRDIDEARAGAERLAESRG